jgi:hypothetical protein
MPIYVNPWATGPTILVTVGITIQQVTNTLLGKLLGPSLLELFLKLTYLLGLISHLVNTAAGLCLPGLL